MIKKFMERFMKKNCQIQVKKSLDLKKVIKKKGEILDVKWKGYDICLIAGQVKKRSPYIKCVIFQNHVVTGKTKKVELGLTNLAPKSDLKVATGINTPKFAKEAHLDNLKSEVDELDIDKLKTVPSALNDLKSKVDKFNVDKLETVLINLKKLSDEVDKDVIKKSEYSKLKQKKWRIRTLNSQHIYVNSQLPMLAPSIKDV